MKFSTVSMACVLNTCLLFSPTGYSDSGDSQLQVKLQDTSVIADKDLAIYTSSQKQIDHLVNRFGGYEAEIAQSVIADSGLQLSNQAREHLLYQLQNRHLILREKLSALLVDAQNENWQSALFTEADAFDALLIGYIDKTLELTDFLDLYGYVEMVHDQKPSGYLAGTVIRRIKVNSLNDKNVKVWRNKVKREYYHILRSRFMNEAFSNTKDYQRYFTVVEFPDCKSPCLKDLDSDDSLNKVGPHKFNYRYLAVLDKEAPIAAVIGDDDKSMVFPPVALIDNFRRSASKTAEDDLIRIVPTLGAHNMKEVRAMRGANQHPFQLYHPAAENLLYPHNMFAGNLAGRHDFFHIMILSFMPKHLQQAFYKVHDIDMELMTALKPAYGPDSKVKSLQDFDWEFLEGMKLVVGETGSISPKIISTFELLVRPEERMGLHTSPLLKSTEYHNSADDQASDIALDLPFPKFISRVPNLQGMEYYTTLMEIIAPTSQTYDGYLRFNYQLYRIVRELTSQTADQKGSESSRMMGFFSYMIHATGTPSADCQLPESTDTEVIEYFRGVKCQLPDIGEEYDDLFAEMNERYLENQLTKDSVQERKESYSMESILRLLHFWIDFVHFNADTKH